MAHSCLLDTIDLLLIFSLFLESFATDFHCRLNDKRVTAYYDNLNVLALVCFVLFLSLLMMFATDCRRKLNDKCVTDHDDNLNGMF